MLSGSALPLHVQQGRRDLHTRLLPSLYVSCSCHRGCPAGLPLCQLCTNKLGRLSAGGPSSAVKCLCLPSVAHGIQAVCQIQVCQCMTPSSQAVHMLSSVHFPGLSDMMIMSK